MNNQSQAGDCEVGIGAYFHRDTPLEYTGNLRNRAVNALRRAGIATMEELCAIPEAELERLHLLGEKSLRLVRYMREKYIEEKG